MFDQGYYDRLARLKLALDKKSTASMQGGRKSTRKGNSAEFSDFREYMPGDDIRSIDWNAYARLRSSVCQGIYGGEGEYHPFLS